MLNRRALLQTAAAGTISAFVTTSARSEVGDTPSFNIIDTNVSLFHWPFRRLPLDETDALVRKLRSLGVTQAWAGTFEGLLHRDVTTVNSRLADACRSYPELVPIGSINPDLPDWEQDFVRCVDTHGMPGVRLHPNYHGYTLDDSRFAELLQLASASQRIVQIAVAMEDTRTQHSNLQVPEVDLAPLVDVITHTPGARVQLLNHRLRPPLLDELAQSPGVCFDTARVEGTDGVPNLVKSVPARRVMFGSHAPFLIPEAALIRVHESGQLDVDALRAVLADNAKTAIESADA